MDAGMALSYAMLATYKENYGFFSFQKCILSINRILLIYDCAAYDGNYYEGRSINKSFC